MKIILLKNTITNNFDFAFSWDDQGKEKFFEILSKQIRDVYLTNISVKSARVFHEQILELNACLYTRQGVGYCPATFYLDKLFESCGLPYKSIFAQYKKE